MKYIHNRKAIFELNIKDSNSNSNVKLNLYVDLSYCDDGL